MDDLPQSLNTMPVLVGGWVLSSIFDDSDPFYHADTLTGETPAQARYAESMDQDTKA